MLYVLSYNLVSWREHDHVFIYVYVYVCVRVYIQHSFAVGQDSGRCVTCMVSYGQGVWVALQGSAQVRLYHSTSYESIFEVDVAPAVHKMLAGTQSIIIGLY